MVCNVGIGKQNLEEAAVLNRKNGLTSSYQGYQARQVKSLCDQIPEGRKEDLLAYIRAKAYLFGYENHSALKNTIKALEVK